MTGAWINEKSYGMFRSGTSVDYADRTTLHDLGKTDGLFSYPVKNYGRFEAVTQRACCLAALALRDAGIVYEKGRRLDVGLLATDLHGCIESNRTYFQDYVDGGRKLSRANLFIYTLPSSPIAEVAVHFGLQGPLLYVRPQEAGGDALAKMANRMVQERQAERVLVFEMMENGGRCFLVAPDDGGIQ